MRSNVLRSLVLAVLALSAPAVHAGMTWQRAATRPTTEFLHSVAWGNGQFVAVGASLTGYYGTVLTSPNGIDWTHRPTPVVPILAGNATLLDVHWNGSQWIAVGQQGGPGAEPIALTSPDGITWTVHVLPFAASSMNAVAWNTGATPSFYAGVGQPTGPSPDVPTYRSDNGSTWTRELVGVQPLHSVFWTGGQFLAVGAGGALRASTNGVSWALRTSGTSNDLYGITLGGLNFVAVGAFGTIRTSITSVDWTARSSGVTSSLHDVAWNGSIFVAVGHGNVVLSSPNSIDWHLQPAPAPLGPADQAALNDVVWGGNNHWVAVGNFGEIIYSSDTNPVELQSFTVE